MFEPHLCNPGFSTAFPLLWCGLGGAAAGWSGYELFWVLFSSFEWLGPGTRARRGGQGGQLEWTTIELSTGLREVARCLKKAKFWAIKDLLRHGFNNGRTRGCLSVHKYHNQHVALRILNQTACGPVSQFTSIVTMINKKNTLVGMVVGPFNN